MNPTISTIYADGISIVATSPNYDPTQPQKGWVRPLATGDDPTDDYVYQYAAVDNSKPAPYVTWHTGVTSKGAAAVANLTPAGYVPPVGVTEAPGVVPIPMDQTKIPSGYTLTGTPFGLVLAQNAPAAAPATPAATDTDTRILTGINALLTQCGLPTV